MSEAVKTLKMNIFEGRYKDTVRERNRFDVITLIMLIPIILINVLWLVGIFFLVGTVLVEVKNSMDVPGIQWLIFILAFISPFYLGYIVYKCLLIISELVAIIFFIRKRWRAYKIIGLVHFILIFLESIVFCPMLLVLLCMISPILPSEGVGISIIMLVWVIIVLAILLWFLYLVVLGVMSIFAMISHHNTKKHYSDSACQRPDSRVTRK